MPHDAVTIRTLILIPTPVVYQALTEPHALSTWFAEFADSAPEDGRFAFWGRYTPYGDVPRQRLLSYDRNRDLRFVWSVPDLDTEVDIAVRPTDANDTVFTVRQAPAPKPTEGHAGLDHFWRLAAANLASFAEGRHFGPRHDYAVPAANLAQAEVTIDASAEEIYTALIELDSQRRVLAASAAGGPDAPRVASILPLDPPVRIAWRWHHPGQQDTTVRWSLIPTGMETRVVVRHGIPTGGPDEYYQFFWRTFLVNLQRMLELGQAWQLVEAHVSYVDD